MTDDELLHPARRFLHLCYCCDDVDPVTEFFVDALGMRAVMRTPVERNVDTMLGIDGEIEGAASFVYDFRGGKVSPAIEIQSWIDPPLVGTPSFDPFEVGFKSVGFTVPSVEQTVAKLTAAGCTVLSTEPSPFGPVWTTLTDARGVTLELVEDPGLAGPSQMRHMRVTAKDLATSIAWYENLGFSLIEQVDVGSPSFVGHDGPGVGKAARLRLPDEPFEAILVEWTNPTSHGSHYETPNHAGMFRCALHVYDTKASMAAMQSAGTEFIRGPVHTVLNVAAQLDMWLAFLVDPNGILYELVGRPATALKTG
jgi:catechol 2,3-dioxygenase-like lactoylglutathione lyase family enzyme